MSIGVNPNAGVKNVDWEKVLSKLGDVQKTTGEDGKESFTITMKTDSGVRTATISIPDDLELPETVTAESLSSLVSKLGSCGLNLTDEQISQMKDEITRLYSEAARSLNEVSASATKKRSLAMYDIYALMALMIEVAQTQRNATREMRTSENLAVQKSIQDQADQQHLAAQIGMWVGIGTGLLSAGVSGIVMASQGVAASQQNKLVSESGAEAAKLQASMLQNTDSKAAAQTQLQTTMNKVGDRVSTDVCGKFDNALRNSPSGDLRGNLGEALANKENADARLDTAKAELATAESTLTTKEATRDQLQEQYDAMGNGDALTAVGEKQAYIRGEMNAGREPSQATIAEYDARIGNLDMETATPENIAQARALKAQLETAKQEVTTATNDVHTKQGNVRIAQEEVKTADTALANARADYQKTVHGVAEGYRQEYQTAVDRLSNPPEGSTKAELEANVKTARANLEMAYAAEADMLSTDGVMTAAQRQDLLASARANVDTTMDSAYRRMDVKALDRKMATLQGIGNINQAIGGVLQSMTQNLNTVYASDATRQGAETAKEEEMLDQTKDLFSQEQKVIDQVIQLCQAVIQAESQSMRDAIQA